MAKRKTQPALKVSEAHPSGPAQDGRPPGACRFDSCRNHFDSADLWSATLSDSTHGPVAELEDAPVSETGGAIPCGCNSLRVHFNLSIEVLPLRSTAGSLSYKQETGVQLLQREPIRV